MLILQVGRMEVKSWKIMLVLFSSGDELKPTETFSRAEQLAIKAPRKLCLGPHETALSLQLSTASPNDLS